MSTLTAYNAFAIYQALPDGEKEAFMRLVEDKRKPQKRKRKKPKFEIEEKYLPGNEHLLIAEELARGEK